LAARRRALKPRSKVGLTSRISRPRGPWRARPRLRGHAAAPS
jgi:hypothetical protein